MRNIARVSICCLALTLVPDLARAQSAEPPADAPQPDPIQPLPPEPAVPPEPVPAMPPEPLEPAVPPEPVPPVAPPEATLPAEPPPPEPPPPPSPELDIPVNVRDATPEERRRGQILRKTGTGLLVSGGVIAASGLGLTIAYTVIGDRREDLDNPVLEDIQQANEVAQVGGILLASGLAVVAVGGVIFSRGKKLGEPKPLARVRVTPSLGGLVVSGQF
jgi:hypothetical protein